MGFKKKMSPITDAVTQLESRLVGGLCLEIFEDLHKELMALRDEMQKAAKRAIERQRNKTLKEAG